MQAEEEWGPKVAERDGQIEDLQGRLWEAERAQGATEDKLKTVRIRTTYIRQDRTHPNS